MKLTAQMSFWGSLVFGLLFLGVGVNGLWHLREITDETLRADAHGFAWFWLFLAAVMLVTCVLSGLMAKGKFGPLDR
jgi:hypothetical protein